jgi:hypothetical protein
MIASSSFIDAARRSGIDKLRARNMTAAMPQDQRRRIIDAIPLNRAAAARYS